MSMTSVSSTTLVVAVQQIQECEEGAKIAEEVHSLAGEYILDSTSQLSCKQSEEHVYRQESGPWVLYWDEKQAGWWFAEEKNYNVTGLFWAAGEKEKVPEAGWHWRGLLGMMYWEVPLSISWKQVLEIVEDIPEPDLEGSSGDVLANIRDMSLKHWQDLKVVTSEKTAAVQHCFVGCFDFLTHPDNIAKVKQAVQTYVPSLGESGEESGEEQRFELLPSVGTWHGPPQLKKVTGTCENSSKSVDTQEEVGADLLRAKEEFIDFFASRAKPDGQRSVLIEQTLRRNVVKQALESNNGLRCLELETQVTSAAETHAQEVSRLRAELWQKEDAAAASAKLQESIRATEDAQKEAQAMAEKQAFRCERLEAALREEEQKALAAAQGATDSDGNAGKVEELASSLKEQAKAVLEMKDYADQQAQKCAEQMQKCSETQALLEESSARIEEMAILTSQAQAEAAESNMRCRDLEMMLPQAKANGSGQEELRNLQADMGKLENENLNLRREADAAVAEAQSAVDSHAKRSAELEALLQEAVAVGGTQEEEVKRARAEADAAVGEAQTVVDSYAKRCAELEALLQEAPAAGGSSQEEVKRVRDEAEAALADAQTVIDSYADRCAEMEALLQQAPAAGGTQDEAQALRAQLANLEGEYSDFIAQADAEVNDLRAQLQEQKASAGDSEEAEVENLQAQMADRIQELEAALETQDMQRIQSIEAELQGQYLGHIKELEGAVQELDSQAALAKQDFKAELDAVNCQWSDQMASSQGDLAQLAVEKGKLEKEISRLKAALVKAESAHPSHTPGVPVPAGTMSRQIPVTTTGVAKAGGSLFDTLNTNNDGGISREEFNRAMAAGAMGGARVAAFNTGSVAKAPSSSSVRTTRTIPGPALRTSAHGVPGHVVSRTVVPASHVVPQGVPTR